MSFPSLQFNRMTGKWREASVFQSKMQVFRLAYLPRAPHTNAAPCPSSNPPAVSNHNKSRKNIEHQPHTFHPSERKVPREKTDKPHSQAPAQPRRYLPWAALQPAFLNSLAGLGSS